MSTVAEWRCVGAHGPAARCGDQSGAATRCQRPAEQGAGAAAELDSAADFDFDLRISDRENSVRTFVLLLLLAKSLAAAAASQVPFAVTVQVEAAKSIGPLPPIWRFFGADEPNYATRPQGEQLLTELGALRPGEVYFRAHHLMTTGDGTADFKWGSTNLYTDQDGAAIYDFTIVDRILDTYLARGIHPYLELGFMPAAMTSAPGDVPYRRPWHPGIDPKGTAAGWSYPPRDYEKWGELIYQWTRHNVERYGRAEVERWYFEVWNEANLDYYWSGTAEDFYRLHDYAIDAVRRALPSARVGGPDLAGSGGAFMDGFLKHVTSGTNYANGKIGTPSIFSPFMRKASRRWQTAMFAWASPASSGPWMRLCQDRRRAGTRP